MNELERVFAHQGTQLLQLIRTGFKTDNRQLIQQMAHRLKNKSRIFGLDSLACLCEQLEESTARTDSSSMEFYILIRHLERAYLQSLTQLKFQTSHETIAQLV